MASIRKRNDSWFAEIRCKNYAPQRKTFSSQALAKAWARRVEYEMDSGAWVDRKADRATHVDEIVDKWVADELYKYGNVVTVSKMSQLNQIKEFFSGVCVHTLKDDSIVKFATARLTGQITEKQICPSTLQQQLSFMGQIFRESDIKIRGTPVADAQAILKKKKLIHSSTRRNRLLLPGEYALLSAAAKSTKHAWIMDHVDLALATGMRQGEIHALRWEEINWKTGIMKVLRKDPTAPGGKKACKVPMVKGVREVLLRVWFKADKPKTGSLWPNVKRSSSVSDKFAKITKRAGIVGLRYHDLRHESLTQISRYIRDVFELQLISGHSNINELLTYVRRAPEELVADYEIG